MILHFILWDFGPTLFKIGSFAARWYGLFFALGFLIGQQVIMKIYKQEGKNPQLVETLTVYMVLATIIGARLGHCLFYEPEWYLAHPIEILKIWEGGLASHGATVGILTAIYFYSKKYPDQGYLWLLDRLVIVIAIAGCCIRLGNLMNSEIIGKYSDKPFAFLFVEGTATDMKEKYADYIDEISYTDLKRDTLVANKHFERVDMTILLRAGMEQTAAHNLVNQELRKYIELHNDPNDKSSEVNLVLLPEAAKLESINNQYKVTLKTLAVPRHPSQLYEAISCLILFGLLLWIYSFKQAATPNGLLLGIFMVFCFGLRFLYEFLKENQVAFEDDLSFNMGQLLSIPLILCGLYLIFNALKKEKTV